MQTRHSARQKFKPTKLLESTGSLLVEYVKQVKLCSDGDLYDDSYINKVLTAVRTHALSLVGDVPQVNVLQDRFRSAYMVVHVWDQRRGASVKLQSPSEQEMQEAMSANPNECMFFVATFARKTAGASVSLHDTCFIVTSELVYFIDTVGAHIHGVSRIVRIWDHYVGPIGPRLSCVR